MATLPQESRAEQRYKEIIHWENQLSSSHNMYKRLFDKTLEKLINTLPQKQKKYLLNMTDRFLFYAQSFILHSRFHEEAEKRIILEARIFDEDVKDIQDLKRLTINQLHFIHYQFMAKQRLFSLGQGGMTGMGGVILNASDLPAVFLINLRTVQLSALCYGYDLRNPFEMMIALKVFHGASLPQNLQKQAWQELEQEAGKEKEFPWFYEGEEKIVAADWLHQPLRQTCKLFLLKALRKKLMYGVPIIGIVTGAACNYQLTKQVSEWAGFFYEKRYLAEHVM
ncbi:EcsC family protein [Alteribacillus bidgolensis]|uniref:EcsC protein family protein n=1 Tax=Alteribacillus bidgolensis TaxID=930129 RepID=A0A1G8EVC1_9BACI|nr:EcsC family protein [Alteribacillus bidgolensis]SDH73851.1 EcsC protein family protein [Alteribacillus bidgolensis]